MMAYAGKRLLQAVPVLILASMAIFLLLRLIPGDLAVVLAGTKGSPEGIAALRKELGLDQPLPVQYAVWLAHVARGDLGTSGLSGQPIAVLLFRVVPTSLELAATSMLLIIITGCHPAHTTGWAPTSSGGTSSAASCSAPRCHSSWPSPRPASARCWGSWPGWPPAMPGVHWTHSSCGCARSEERR